MMDEPQKPNGDSKKGRDKPTGNAKAQLSLTTDPLTKYNEIKAALKDPAIKWTIPLV
jgi:hypothetical protein